MISARTLDRVSSDAEERLLARYATPKALAEAEPGDVATLISNVEFADAKAVQVVTALRRIEREVPDFDLSFLGRIPLAEGLAWLERFDGVGRKVSASVFNASTLAKPVFIADTHVVRVLRRLGFVPAQADYRATSEAVTAAMPSWPAHQFLEFHDLVKKLGQTICRPSVALCETCPLAADCPARSV